MGITDFTVVEAGLAEVSAALAAGTITSVDLAVRYLNRIAYYDHRGTRLNAVPVLNPRLFEDARAADVRRARGESLGPLDGVVYSAKDSYKARGLTVAAGSPAFENLVATDDAFAISRLRAAGAVLIGLTNMPPMANGGMQRGLYGRAESPYNSDYLTAAFGSGSSNGSGTATAASFAAFGLGEETWSSGRAPAANNGLVAYTPSRGVISVRGNWPLVPTMDVVVPHTRSVDDLFTVLDTIVADDIETRGDFWRVQPWVHIPRASEVRPTAYTALRDADALKGRRLGAPRMYINRDDGGAHPIATRASVIALWEDARQSLEALGAEVVEVDFPVVSNYERDRPGARSMVDRGIVPEGFADREIWDLSICSWDDFLSANADPGLHALADVDGSRIFPQLEGALPDRYGELDFDLAEYPKRARESGVAPLEEIPLIPEGLRGLEETRRIDLEEWLIANGLDAVVFPAVADVGRADADTDPEAADEAWRNGTWVANGNQVIRHLGIPTVTVTMGLMADIGMPAGLTFAGAAYSDSELLRFAYAFERSGARRRQPGRTPSLPNEGGADARGAGTGPASGAVASGAAAGGAPASAASDLRVELSASVSAVAADGSASITVRGSATASAGISSLTVFVDGVTREVERTGDSFEAVATLPASERTALHSQWRGPYGSIVIAVAADETGAQVAQFVIAGGV